MNDGPHILIVDDHREMRDLVSRALAKEGFRISTAPDGKAMRKVLSDANIDLILLDLMLPGEDGLSLCRSLVEHPQRTLSRDQLLDLARHRSANAFDRSMDTQVSRLRKKVERDPAAPAIIKTVWGGGYIFTPDVSRE